MRLTALWPTGQRGAPGQLDTFETRRATSDGARLCARGTAFCAGRQTWCAIITACGGSAIRTRRLRAMSTPPDRSDDR